MKQSILLFALAMTATMLQAQQPSEKTAQEKMKPFAGWVGRWQGEGSMQMGPGEPKKSNVDERIEMKLNGAVVAIEGVGTATDPTTKQESVVHHAFAILSFDQATNQYKMKSYLKDGRSTDAWFTIVSESQFQWGFDFPSGKMRYTINIDVANKTWSEIGEFSRDGNTWMKSFSMNLKKVD